MEPPTVNPEPVDPTIVVSYHTVEVFNDTLSFPRNGQGENQAAEVVLEPDARNATVTVWRRMECPVTTFDAPSVSITGSDGQVTSVSVVKEGGLTYTCPFVEPADEQVAQFNPPGGEGSWAIATQGDCTCTVRVAILAEVPE